MSEAQETARGIFDAMTDAQKAGSRRFLSALEFCHDVDGVQMRDNVASALAALCRRTGK